VRSCYFFSGRDVSGACPFFRHAVRIYLAGRAEVGIHLAVVEEPLRMAITAVFEVLLVLSLSLAGFTQTTATNPHQSSGTSPGQGYLTSPFDIRTLNVGSGFRGHNIIEIVKRLQSAPALAEKSEFESSRAYEARKATFRSQKIIGDMTSDSYFAFVADKDAFTYGLVSSFKYDADAQLMRIRLPGDTQEFYLGNEARTMQTIPIQSVKRENQPYVGSNAFGATVEVSSASVREYGLSFEAGSWIFGNTESYEPYFSRSLPMPPEAARRVKANAVFLIVCRLTDPWYLFSSHTDRATHCCPS
jgi:hypothetical protein